MKTTVFFGMNPCSRKANRNDSLYTICFTEGTDCYFWDFGDNWNKSIPAIIIPTKVKDWVLNDMVETTSEPGKYPPMAHHAFLFLFHARIPPLRLVKSRKPNAFGCSLAILDRTPLRQTKRIGSFFPRRGLPFERGERYSFRSFDVSKFSMKFSRLSNIDDLIMFKIFDFRRYTLFVHFCDTTSFVGGKRNSDFFRWRQI